MLWKAGPRTLDLSLMAGELAGFRDLGDCDPRHEAYENIDAYGESLSGALDRQRVIQALCKALDVHWSGIEQKRVASFVNVDELRKIAGMGIDVQLHTHRHRFPHDSFEEASFEIEENRRVLSAITDRPLEHFCCPSGSYRKEQLPWLAELGIRSATTTKRGFNRHNQNAFELRRFLDSESVSQLEFEAEMNGFFELIRRFGYSI